MYNKFPKCLCVYFERCPYKLICVQHRGFWHIWPNSSGNKLPKAETFTRTIPMGRWPYRVIGVHQYRCNIQHQWLRVLSQNTHTGLFEPWNILLQIAGLCAMIILADYYRVYIPYNKIIMAQSPAICNKIFQGSKRPVLVFWDDTRNHWCLLWSGIKTDSDCRRVKINFDVEKKGIANFCTIYCWGFIEYHIQNPRKSNRGNFIFDKKKLYFIII